MLRKSLVDRLVSFVRAADARIVLSTTWRSDAALRAELLSALRAAGLPEGQHQQQAVSCKHATG